jgi:hypothetical protein
MVDLVGEMWVLAPLEHSAVRTVPTGMKMIH